MCVPKALPLLPLALFAVPALADGNCVLQQTCFEDQSCEAAEMVLAWAPDRKSKIWVDGEELRAEWIKAGESKNDIRMADTTWIIVNSSDVIWASNDSLSLGIARKDRGSTVTATYMPVRSGRYVDYAEMISQRRIFSGECEGLF